MSEHLVVATYVLVCCGTIWFAICNHRTYKHRGILIDAVHAENTRRIFAGRYYPLGRFNWADFNSVSYWRHLWSLFTFRDPFQLYPQWLRPDPTTTQPQAVS